MMRRLARTEESVRGGQRSLLPRSLRKISQSKAVPCHLMKIAMQICNSFTRLMWTTLAAITIVSEVVPVPRMNPFLHYGVYCVSKVSCFLMLGYLLPMAFKRINVLHRGIAFAAISAAAIESLQAFIGNGHSFHWYELIAKWFVIMLGFAFGLDARCTGSVEIGKLQVSLVLPARQGRN